MYIIGNQKLLLRKNQLLIDYFELVSFDEKQKMLVDFNETYMNYPRSKTIIDLFKTTVKSYPNKNAIIVSGKLITYSELYLTVIRIASNLPKIKNKKLPVVAIYLTRRFEIVASMLAAWYCGYTCLCIDTNHPVSRVKHMVESSQSLCVITEKSILKNIESKHQYIDIDTMRYNNDCDFQAPKAKDVALLIYTSGSTGLPKGVKLTHQNLINFSYYYIQARDLKVDDQIAEYASFSFDAAILGAIPVLMIAGTLHILQRKIQFSLALLDNYFNENNIKGCLLTTKLGEQYISSYDNKTLAFLEVGGEKLQIWKKRSYDIINLYGPSETTIFITEYLVKRHYSNIPIGHPIANTQIYILNKNLQLCPIGVIGELCVSGDSVSGGYINLKEADSNFIKNPYANFGDSRILKEILYKTGDRARWLPNGNIEYIGRIDYQLKIRGYRIEPGEIENFLVKIPCVRAAVVIEINDGNSDNYLCAYYQSEILLDNKIIKGNLKKNLPDYMIPQEYIYLESFPLTVTGKVDVASLPRPVKKIVSHVSPRCAVEKKLVVLWQDILNIKEVCIDHSFFEIGGCSIKAITFVYQAQLAELNLSINDLYVHKTIRKITQNIDLLKFDLNFKFKQIISNFYKRISVEENECLKEELELSASRMEALNKNFPSICFNKYKSIKTVLVTGATGFLGSHIIRELIRSNIKVITLVRADNDARAIKRVKEKFAYYFDDLLDDSFKNGSLTVFSGDLENTMLGLDNQRYNKIILSVDSIIHAAANVNHYGEYEMFYNANVLTTKYLINLAQQGNNICFHYISTRSVCEHGKTDKEYLVLNESDTPSESGMNNLYVLTKLQGEKLTIEARKKGINTNIYRIGNLVFNSETLEYQENRNDNGFFQTLKSILKLGYFYQNYSVEMSCVNDSAIAICTIFNKVDLQNGIYHTYNDHKTDLSKILSMQRLDLKLQLLSFKGFIDKIRENYNKVPDNDYIKDLMLHLGWLHDDLSGANHIIQQDYTCKILDQLKFKWCEINSDNINKLISYANFLE